MSFSGQSNPPWQRNALAGNSSATNNMGVQNAGSNLHFQNQQQNLFSQQQQQQQQVQQNQSVSYPQINQMHSTPQPLFAQAVSYPTARGGLNPIAFPSQQQTVGIGGGQQHNSQQNQNPNIYNAIGIVTKMNQDYGFVDNEVFFYKNVCKGGIPKIGDRVLVEAAQNINPNIPVKLNATRVQIVPTQRQAPPPPLISGSSSQKGGSAYSAVPPPNEYAGGRMGGNSGRDGNRRGISPPRRLQISPDRRGSDSKKYRPREEEDLERKKRREEREKDRERRDLERSLDRRDREKSPVVRRLSPRRRKARTVPRYMVQIPSTSFIIKQADVLALRNRYNSLYIPSDFFYSNICWNQSFPPDSCFSIQKPCEFHVMHKTIDKPGDADATATPPDADYLYSAKVMLMGIPTIAEIYQKCLFDAEKYIDRDEEPDHCHPTRLINFLVGTKGKNETMAIGGPWSKSLDGSDPKCDPAVLIRTAIRTCKALTGIDLSGCAQWYRFLELCYRRPETLHKGAVIPERTETVVIFLPDINSCMPTRIEWDRTTQLYKTTLEHLLNGENGESSLVTSEMDSTVDKRDVDGSLDPALTAAVADNQKGDPIKREPTHYSKLDVKTLKIPELREELEARDLNSKGLKPQLIARLQKAINIEKSSDKNRNIVDVEMKDGNVSENSDSAAEKKDAKEQYESVEVDMTDIVVLDEYDSTKVDERREKKKPKVYDEKERQKLTRRYELPEAPHIIVHPSKTAKSGNFDCTVMSLSVLLDYRPEDNKEHIFEVSLFAELFNEMLMRDFGFNIYKELASIPEKVVEKKSSTEDEKKEKNGSTNNNKDKDKENVEKNDVRHEKRPNDGERSEKGSRSQQSKERSRSRDRSRHTYDTEDDASVISAGKRNKKRKSMIVKPDLLLSFTYFDTTHCGYIFEKDCEDLIHSLGLHLSRSQIRKVISKFVTKDSLYYRKLTDKTIEEEDGNSTENTEVGEGLPVDVAGLAKGNLKYIESEILEKQTKTTDGPPGKRSRSSANEEDETINAENQESGLVSYNGGMFDVGKLIEQMKRSENTRVETEKLLIELRKQNSELQATNSKSSAKIKDLQIDTKSLGRKLSDAEQNISALNRKQNEYYSVLSCIYDRVNPIFAKQEKLRDKERDRERETFKRDDKDRDRPKKDDKSTVLEMKMEKESSVEKRDSCPVKKESKDDKDDEINLKKDDTDLGDKELTESVEQNIELENDENTTKTDGENEEPME